ncbi:MAG: IPT/TIG domain-containing protein, partial [Candidatus Rokuibacteriota bacterium]
MTRRLGAWVRRRGVTRVIFELFLIIQLGHLGEHLAQMAQLFIMGWPPAQARGIVSQLDVEKVHFLWNLIVLVALGWLLQRGVRSTWLTATTVWAVLHSSEHGYLLTRALMTGLEGQPGVLGAGGLLASWGWTLSGLTTWSRPTVHFFWNLGEVALLVLAYVAFRTGSWHPVPARRWVPAALVALLALVPGTSSAPVSSINALAPVEVVLDSAQELVGVAVKLDGTAYVSDAAAGVVYQIAPDGTASVAVSGLQRPAGLALDLFGRLLIAEEGAGRVLRRASTGALTELASGLHAPRWLAANLDGSLYVSHHGGPPDGPDPSEGREIVRIAPGQSPLVVATGLSRLEGLARVGADLIAATVSPQSTPTGQLLRFPLRPGGALDPPSVFLDIGPQQPVGLMQPGQFALVIGLYTGLRELTGPPDPAQRGIDKVRLDATRTAFAEHLDDPRGLTLGPDGSLYLADGTAGRLLRFRAPPSPVLDALPPVTTQTAITVTGHTEPEARVDVVVLVNLSIETVVTATADAQGAFSLSVPITPDAVNTLAVLATAHGGDGLTSVPTLVVLTHDEQAPGVSLLQPPAGTFVRGTVNLQAQATDPGGVASLTFRLDASALTTVTNPTPESTNFTASAQLVTTGRPEGAHVLAAVARDRAGNSASAAHTILIDNTPPDTQLTGGPTGEVDATSATFTFTGSDNFTATANLRFAWRLDGGAFSAFSAATSATLTGLTQGPHTFEVKARDLAGNEDPTPATRSFTVRSGPSITAVDPASGAIGTLVTITGANLAPGPTTVAFNGVAAVVRSLAAGSLVTTVPPGATTGPITVTTPRGTASHPFTVVSTQEFGLQVAPTSTTILQGTATAYTVTLQNTGANPFTGLASLSVTGLPTGVTAAFAPAATLTGCQLGTLTLTAEPTAQTGLAALTVTASAPTDIGTQTRAANVNVDVVPGGRTAVLGRITFVSGQPIPGVQLMLGSVTAASDAAGNFQLVDVPDGVQMLMIDANAAQAGLPIYAVEVTTVAGQATQLPPFRITPPPPPERFTPINNAAQTQVITDDRFPGFALTLPAGVTITGWDNTLKTQVAIERLSADALPVPTTPPGVGGSLFQIFFGTPMGGLPSAKLPVTLPNELHLSPGDKAEIWYYDAAPIPGVPAGWRLAGEGTVSEDGTRVVSDPGVGLER